MSVATECASSSSIMEYLLTDHAYRRQIAELPSGQIERLRTMLDEAVEQRIAPQEIYDAVTQGFDRILGAPVSSSPLAAAPREDEANKGGHGSSLTGAQRGVRQGIRLQRQVR